MTAFGIPRSRQRHSSGEWSVSPNNMEVTIHRSSAIIHLIYRSVHAAFKKTVVDEYDMSPSQMIIVSVVQMYNCTTVQ